ncbi:MAG: hypothetical protein ACXAAI_07445 [Promethearchaeota archaeon]|jgi:hypothetical protein
MPCIHGLEEENCPTCRILKSTLPTKGFVEQKSQLPEIGNLFFKKNRSLDENVKKEILQGRPDLTPDSLNRIPQPRFINDLPRFENHLFQERIKELDITKEDMFGITKKIVLEKPNLRFKKDE